MRGVCTHHETEGYKARIPFLRPRKPISPGAGTGGGESTEPEPGAIEKFGSLVEGLLVMASAVHRRIALYNASHG